MDDGEFLPDPDYDPEQADEVAEQDASALTRSAVLVGVAAVSFCGVLALLGVPGMGDVARGMAVGCAVAIINLRILAHAAWWIFNERVVPGLLGFLVSFACLLGTAAVVLSSYPSWALGFGVGLSLPAGAGILYAVRQSRRE